MDLLTVKNLSFHMNEQTILNNVSLSIKKGELVTLFGPTGSGKSTLLKLLKPQLELVGQRTGDILFNGQPFHTLSPAVTATSIGYVLQNPNEQIVMEKVWQELAFGLENLGVPHDEMQQRIGEIANFFGIHKWFHQSTNELSGGQKQLLNLAAVLVMNPDVLLLDEPTSQLDPIAASEFIQMLTKINRELGITILIIEHRLEELLPICDRVLFLENGELKHHATPQTIGSALNQHPMLDALTAATQIYCRLEIGEESPVTVRDGMQYMQKYTPREYQAKQLAGKQQPLIEVKDVYFRYGRTAPDVVAGAHFTIHKGEIFSIVGSNGVGKSTLLQLLVGVKKPYKGKILIEQQPLKKSDLKIVLLPQNPQTLFIKQTVHEELTATLQLEKLPKSQIEQAVNAICEELHITYLQERNPLDLSGGEQQKVALAKLLLLKPDILLLDEPTKGVDVFSKKQFAALLKNLQQQVTTIIVTHDIEFSAQVSTRCAMFFDKRLIAISTPQQFFMNNRFYTTAASRIARTVFPRAITVNDVVHCCQQQIDGGSIHEQPITASN
ncbi:MAG: energy-coupling factor transporter ATPase [Solibacillus sp.]